MATPFLAWLCGFPRVALTTSFCWKSSRSLSFPAGVLCFCLNPLGSAPQEHPRTERGRKVASAYGQRGALQEQRPGQLGSAVLWCEQPLGGQRAVPGKTCDMRGQPSTSEEALGIKESFNDRNSLCLIDPCVPSFSHSVEVSAIMASLSALFA